MNGVTELVESVVITEQFMIDDLSYNVDEETSWADFIGTLRDVFEKLDATFEQVAELDATNHSITVMRNELVEVSVKNLCKVRAITIQPRLFTDEKMVIRANHWVNRNGTLLMNVFKNTTYHICLDKVTKF